jgi:hypothetical protein
MCSRYSICLTQDDTHASSVVLFTVKAEEKLKKLTLETTA